MPLFTSCIIVDFDSWCSASASAGYDSMVPGPFSTSADPALCRLGVLQDCGELNSCCQGMVCLKTFLPVKQS